MVAVMGRTGSKIEPGITAAPPATMSTTMVSPTALPMPRMMAVEMPEPAAGITTLVRVCHRLAPSARDASRKLRGTKLNASSARLATVGVAMMPRISDAVKALSPEGTPRRFWMKGATMIMPKKPKMMDGIPARISIRGFSTARCDADASSWRNRAVPTPTGTHTTMAPRVTTNEAVMSGSIPKSAGSYVGYQYRPKTVSKSLWLTRKGNDSQNRVRTIPVRNSREAKARIVNIHL
jgi:hypothetical protein